jgi:dipeptidyl aminopeptidase/acylaminoacyl peptidase
MGDSGKDISPLHHLKKPGPPAIIFHGTADTAVPFSEAMQFCAEEKRLGARCEVVPAEGEAHGFFNYGRGGNVWYRKTLEAADAFLVSLGYLPAK